MRSESWISCRSGSTKYRAGIRSCRQVTCTGGKVRLRIDFMARFDYAAGETRIEALRHGLRHRSQRRGRHLPELRHSNGTSATGAGTSPSRGDTHWLVLRYDDDDVHPVNRYDSARKLEVTAAYWSGPRSFATPDRTILTSKLCSRSLHRWR